MIRDRIGVFLNGPERVVSRVHARGGIISPAFAANIGTPPGLDQDGPTAMPQDSSNPKNRRQRVRELPPGDGRTGFHGTETFSNAERITPPLPPRRSRGGEKKKFGAAAVSAARRLRLGVGNFPRRCRDGPEWKVAGGGRDREVAAPLGVGERAETRRGKPGSVFPKPDAPGGKPAFFRPTAGFPNSAPGFRRRVGSGRAPWLTPGSPTGRSARSALRPRRFPPRSSRRRRSPRWAGGRSRCTRSGAAVRPRNRPAPRSG